MFELYSKHYKLIFEHHKLKLKKQVRYFDFVKSK